MHFFVICDYLCIVHCMPRPWNICISQFHRNKAVVHFGDQSRILADEQHGIFALGVWGMQVHMYCIEYWVWSWNICTGGMWYASLSLLGWGSDRLGGPTQYSILNTLPLDPNPRTLRINITVGLGQRCCQIYQGAWVGPLNTQYSILYPWTLTPEP